MLLLALGLALLASVLVIADGDFLAWTLGGLCGGLACLLVTG